MPDVTIDRRGPVVRARAETDRGRATLLAHGTPGSMWTPPWSLCLDRDGLGALWGHLEGAGLEVLPGPVPPIEPRGME
jgi:hypothetical protein